MSTFVSDDGMDDLASLLDDGTGTTASSGDVESPPSAVAGKARGRGNQGQSKAVGKYLNCNVCGSDGRSDCEGRRRGEGCCCGGSRR